MHNCPCGSQLDYLSCCEPFIKGEKIPATPEALMRSRYTAYTMVNIDYIKATMRKAALIGFQETDAKKWAKRVNWIKLQVFNSSIQSSNIGYVEFEASFIDGSRLKSIHEKSRFIKDGGYWYYVDGVHYPPTFTEQNIARTTSCPCGSGRKFKNCHRV